MLQLERFLRIISEMTGLGKMTLVDPSLAEGFRPPLSSLNDREGVQSETEQIWIHVTSQGKRDTRHSSALSNFAVFRAEQTVSPVPQRAATLSTQLNVDISRLQQRQKCDSTSSSRVRDTCGLQAALFTLRQEDDRRTPPIRSPHTPLSGGEHFT